MLDDHCHSHEVITLGSHHGTTQNDVDGPRVVVSPQFCELLLVPLVVKCNNAETESQILVHRFFSNKIIGQQLVSIPDVALSEGTLGLNNV